MDTTGSTSQKNPWYKKKLLWVMGIILIVISGIVLFVYINFNKLLSEALLKSFHSTLVSDVYELKFDKLRVNIFEGDIRVSNVVLQPREHPLESYPYINSSFRLTTDNLILKKVEIRQLLKENILKLERIEIDQPDVQLTLAGAVHVIFPFKDSTSVTTEKKQGKKKSLDSYYLKKFELIDADFRVTNSYEKREFAVENLNFAFNDLYMSQHIGLDSLVCKSVTFSIESLKGSLLKSSVREISFKSFKFEIDRLHVQKSLDTLMFGFDDFRSAINDLDIETADSIYHITMQAFGLSYKDQTINISGVEFKPNVSEAEIQKKYRFQHTQFSGKVGSVKFVNVNFDSLVHHGKLFVDELLLDSVSASIFKDKTKPMDLQRFPEYPGQQIASIPLPIHIKKVQVKNGDITNRERKPDRGIAKVTVNRMSATVENFTNLASDKPLSLKGEAYLENKVFFKVDLDFDYTRPQFTINAKISKFDIRNLNALLKAYTPAKTNAGIVDEILLSGIVYHSHATGTLKFLYHDLNLDLQLKEQAQWKSTLGALAANTVLNASNPPSSEKPARIVKYEVERDMNKGFINIVIKSLLMGVKETMIPSKENRKAFHQTKKEFKKSQNK